VAELVLIEFCGAPVTLTRVARSAPAWQPASFGAGPQPVEAARLPAARQARFTGLIARNVHRAAWAQARTIFVANGLDRGTEDHQSVGRRQGTAAGMS
jgi:hypothetical protein